MRRHARPARRHSPIRELIEVLGFFAVMAFIVLVLSVDQIR